MINTIYIFIFIFCTIILYNVFLIRNFIKQRKLNFFIKRLGTSLFLLGFCFCWFVPVPIGEIGEANVCKFRFQVYSVDGDDYGSYGSFLDLFFKVEPKKYGSLRIISKETGVLEYFNLKPLPKDIERYK